MDSKKKRSNKSKSTIPIDMITNKTNKEILHQLIDDMELQYTNQIKQLEDKQASELSELKLESLQDKSNILQSQTKLEELKLESLQDKSIIQRLQLDLEESKKQSNLDISTFKDVSILNQYLKEIYQLKNENTILTKRFDTTKKLLEQSQKENKHFRELQKELSIVHLPEPSAQISISAVEAEEEEEEEDEVEEVEEDEVEEVEVEEVAKEVEEEEVEEVEEVEAEEVEEVDVNKLDIIEVDDTEYYLDLDNHIRDKKTLRVIGKVTDDGDAIFN